MCREKSCGAVIFQRQGELLTYLVLHSVLGHWTLCKGHVEGSETEHETALREIREETGLSVKFVEPFREVITYFSAPNVTKDVVFFLAEAEAGSPVCQPEEVSEIRFLPFEEAIALLTHLSDRETLTKAATFLSGQEQ